MSGKTYRIRTPADFLAERIISIAYRREPDFVIRRAGQEPYLQRWWLIPRNPVFGVYLHRFLNDDDDRALHDHPWPNVSILLRGGYVEVTPLTKRQEEGAAVMPGRGKRREYFAGDIKFRGPRSLHRIELLRDGTGKRVPCWTLFIRGPVVREWGFACPKGWRPWREFVDARDKGAIGRGCE